MRGFGFLLGYIIGNEKARNWCVNKICEASCLIDKEVLSKMKKEIKNVRKADKTELEISAGKDGTCDRNH